MAVDAAAVEREPLLDSFLAYWNAKRGGRAMPSWRDIDPVGMPAMLLPHIVVWTVQAEPLDFHCVLAGNHIVTHYGQTQARRWLSDLIRENPTLATFRNRFVMCLERRQPLITWDRFVGRDEFEKVCLGAIAPLSADGATIDRLICCALYKPLTLWPPDKPHPAPQSAVEVYRPT